MSAEAEHFGIVRTTCVQDAEAQGVQHTCAALPWEGMCSAKATSAASQKSRSFAMADNVDKVPDEPFTWVRETKSHKDTSGHGEQQDSVNEKNVARQTAYKGLEKEGDARSTKI